MSPSQLINLANDLWLREHPEYEERPVNIRTFVDSPYFLNMKKTCWESIKDLLEEIFGKEFDPDKLSKYNLVLYTGGIGTGKTTVSSIGFAYVDYVTACLRNPVEHYHLMEGRRIALMNMSSTRSNAMEVLFGDVKATINNCQWFKDNFPPNPEDPRLKNVIKFNKDIVIIPGDSQEKTFEGYNILFGVIDEADSHLKTKTKDYADIGFSTIEGRVITRFGDKGLIFIIGQKKSQTGFIARKLEEFQDDPKVLCVHRTVWEAKPKSSYSGKTFYFNPYNRVVVPKNEYKKSEGMLEIPIEYYSQFIRQPEKALKDLAGIPPYAHQPFFAMPDLVIAKAVLPSPVDKLNVLQKWFKCNDSMPRVCHIDLGLNKEGSDFAGIAMGHIHGMKNYEGEEKPEIYIDYVQRIIAPPGGEIMIADIRKIIYHLQELGFKIIKVTGDGWNSQETFQQFRKKRIPAELLSIHQDTEVYNNLKDCIYENRILYPKYILKDDNGKEFQPLLDEALALEYIEGEKCDHPPGGSKDLLDATAGVVTTLLTTRKARTSFVRQSLIKLGEKTITKLGGNNENSRQGDISFWKT